MRDLNKFPHFKKLYETILERSANGAWWWDGIDFDPYVDDLTLDQKETVIDAVLADQFFLYLVRWHTVNVEEREVAKRLFTVLFTLTRLIETNTPHDQWDDAFSREDVVEMLKDSFDAAVTLTEDSVYFCFAPWVEKFKNVIFTLQQEDQLLQRSKERT